MGTKPKGRFHCETKPKKPKRKEMVSLCEFRDIDNRRIQPRKRCSFLNLFCLPPKYKNGKKWKDVSRYKTFHVTVKSSFVIFFFFFLDKRKDFFPLWKGTRNNENGSVASLESVCVIMKNEKSNLAIVLNERTYAYTHGIYKAVCFIFFESTVIASGYFLLSFLIISRVHETAHTRSPSFAQSSIYERYT